MAVVVCWHDAYNFQVFFCQFVLFLVIFMGGNLQKWIYNLNRRE